MDPKDEAQQETIVVVSETRSFTIWNRYSTNTIPQLA